MLLVVLTVLAVALAMVQAWTGVMELALYFAPLFLLGGLLLSGRFVGEVHVIARLKTARRGAIPRPARAVGRPGLTVALVGQLLVVARPLRGPPAALAPAA
jgi:hypothetical protein